MAKCGNCNLEFKNNKQQVRHMLDVHESPFIDGSEHLQAIQADMAKEDPVIDALVKKAREE